VTLYLDSALIEDARQAAALGFVRGITTNPVLLAQGGRAAVDVIPALCDIVPGIVFHQVAGVTVADREAEARLMTALRPGRIGLKIPCTLDNLALAARLAREGHIVGITAIFSAAQTYLACEVGARYVLPYVNRSTRLQGDGPGLVRAMRAVIDASDAPVEIIAASIKTPQEAVDTVIAGAHHLTLPLPVILAMPDHPLSAQAIEAFDAAR
jgi:transaldolase